MDRACDVCGTKYVARTAKSRFCSAKCRQKASRQRTSNAPIDIAAKRNAPKRQRNADRNARDEVPAASERKLGAIEQSTLDSLSAAGVETAPLGASALGMARLLDRGLMTASAYAALNREWRATTAIALSQAKVAADPLDELNRRRLERRAGA